MPNKIKFDEDVETEKILSKIPTRTDDNSVLIQFLLNSNIVKTRENANYVLLTIAIIAIILSYFLYLSGKAPSQQNNEINIEVAGPDGELGF